MNATDILRDLIGSPAMQTDIEAHDEDLARTCSPAEPGDCTLCKARHVIETTGEPLTDDQQDLAGNALADALGLQTSKLHPGRFITYWGTKTGRGFYRTIKSLIEDAERGDLTRILNP